jgi:hypothetical protein
MTASPVRLCLLAAATSLGACTSHGLHLTATPLAKGTWQAGAVISAIVQDRGLGPELLPNPELTLRWGLGENMDLGGRVNVASLAFDARYRMWRAGALSMAVVPETGFGLNTSTNDDVGPLAAVVGFGLLTDLRLGPVATAVLGVRFRSQLEFSNIAFLGRWQGKWVLMPGGTLGVRFEVASGLFLFPELSLLARYDTLATRWLPPTGQLGVAIEWL